MNKSVIPIVLLILICSLMTYAQSDKMLWYNHPADYFEETLPLGNGKMGCAVFGGVSSDKIYLNDITLWSGEPVNPNNNPDAYKNVPLVRKALEDGNYKLADSLNKKIQGAFSQSYAPLGTMYLDFKGSHEYKNYRRELDISKAIAKISYEEDGVSFQREYFVSHPDQVMVIRLTSSEKQAINCSIKFESLLKYRITKNDDEMVVNGYAPYHVEPNYRGDMPNAVMFDENRGTRFSSLFGVKCSDGEVMQTDSTLEFSNCSEAVVYVSVATSFNGFDKDPAKEGVDNRAIAAKNLSNALHTSYEELKRRHLEDYQSLFDRVKLSLDTTSAQDIPTDERLLRYSEGYDDKALEILYFQYGRYLFISSSRTSEVPANLQGLWNPYIRPPWSSNYTLNINVEENYWLAEIANLSELHKPLLSFIKGVAATGAVTAKTYYGTAGWAAGHNSDIWALSNPVGDFGTGDPNWANWNMGGVWLSTHLWEHYEFTQDQDFLKQEAYPLMKGAVEFCLGWMVKDKDGKWITSPCTSPENLYITDDGYTGATFYGGAADIAMIREILEDFISASKVLNESNDFVDKVVQVHKDLLPYKIGKKGNLQEWYYDWNDQDPQHRHQSHLFGLYPGHQILPSKTPVLADACRQALEIKGDQTTGWSMGWRINLWARLGDGNRAYRLYRDLLKYVDPDGFKGSHGGHGGTYPNLFDAHPPFQIDGNFGGASAVIEMLMQSADDKIYLLPALPDAWTSGSIEGICARGGFEVSLQWENNTLVKSEITARVDGTTTLIYGKQSKEISLKKGATIVVNW